MAKFDYGGGCPCGLYRTCIEQCEHYVVPGSGVEMKAKEGLLVGGGAGEVYAAVGRGRAFVENVPPMGDMIRDIERRMQNNQTVTEEESRLMARVVAKPPKVVWVVGREYEPTNKLMFFWEEEEARRVVRALERVGDVDGNASRVGVWSVEVEGREV